MKFAFAAIVVGLNIIFWEGCSSSNGTTTRAPTTSSPTTGAPTTGAPTTGGPTTPPGPAPNGVFVYNGTVKGLGDLTGEVESNNASNPMELTKLLVASKQTPNPPLFINTKPVPFRMDGSKIILTDLSGFAPQVRGFIESATLTYVVDKSITVALTQPLTRTMTFEKVPSSSGRLLRDSL